MTILEVYEKYKHLDYLFSKEDWMIQPDGGGRQIASALYDCWQAIREAAKEESE